MVDGGRSLDTLSKQARLESQSLNRFECCGLEGISGSS